MAGAAQLEGGPSSTLLACRILVSTMLEAFQQACETAEQRQSGVLRTILAANSGSALALKHGLSGALADAEELFKARAPLTTYKNYEQTVAKAIQVWVLVSIGAWAVIAPGALLWTVAHATAQARQLQCSENNTAGSLRLTLGTALPTLRLRAQAAEADDEAGYATAAAKLAGTRATMFGLTSGTTGASKLIPANISRVTDIAEVLCCAVLRCDAMRCAVLL